MKLQYENGKLSFDFYEAVSEMPEADRLQLIDTLACDDAVIKFVTQQILDGCTEQGSYGGSFAIAISDPKFGLDWARRQIALRSDEVTRKEIERLQSALATSEKRYQELVWEREERRRAYP